MTEVAAGAKALEALETRRVIFREILLNSETHKVERPLDVFAL